MSIKTIMERDFLNILLAGGAQLKKLAVEEKFILELYRHEADGETARSVSIITVMSQDLINTSMDVMCTFGVKADKMHSVCQEILDIQMQSWYKYCEEKQRSSQIKQQPFDNQEPTMTHEKKTEQAAPEASATKETTTPTAAEPTFMERWGSPLKTFGLLLTGAAVGAGVKTLVDRRKAAASPEAGVGSGGSH